MSNLAGWGRHYVARGWKLLAIHVLVNGVCSCGKNPCGDTGKSGEPGYSPQGKNAAKHPVSREWNNPLNAVQTDLQVDRMWGESVALQYSMGLLCGQPSKVWVLDIDPRNGGYESLEELEAEIGVMPETLRARTGGGGLHIFFALPQGLILKKGPLHKDLPGIDVQAEGSQIVLAPSLHRSGTRYAWETPLDTPLAEAPQMLVNLVKGNRGSSGGGAGGSGVDIDKIMTEGIPEGQRNNTMYKVACKYARQLGVDTDEQKRLVIGAVRTFNNEFVKPPLELDELLTLTRSALDFIAANPSTKDIDPAMADWIATQRAKQEGVQSEATSTTDQDVVDQPESPQDGAENDEPGDGDGGLSSSDSSGSGGDAAPPPLNPDSPGAAGGDDPPPVAPDPDSLGDDGIVGGRSETDNGNARRIVDYHGHNLRYTPTAGWFYWDESTWRYDQDQLQITEHARTLPAYISAEVLNLPLAQASQSTLLDWAIKSKDAGRIRKAVALANTDRRVYLHHTKWDSQRDWLGVKNGVIDLRTGRLMAPDRTQFITKRAACEYDPRRRDTRFQIWLDQVTNGDREFQSWLQRVVGYTLTGETSEQKFFLVYGPPGSGKSTILEIVRSCLGEYSYSLQAENIMAQRNGANSSDQYFVAELEGRRMIGVSELPEAELMKEDAIKRLTGGDALTGRRVAQQPFVFHSQAKLWVATNHRPRVKDPGVWRRMKAIPFEFIPPAPDQTLKPYLQSPSGGLPGVLAWAVEGARQWYATAGTVGGGIGRCKVVDEATEEYKQNEDELGQFLAEEMRAGDGLAVGLSDAFDVYERWQEDRGTKNSILARFQRSLRDRGVEIEGSGRRAVIRGYALQPRIAPVQEDASSWGAVMAKARF